MTTPLQRFNDCMNFSPSDARPNHELGVWIQTLYRWRQEAPDAVKDFTWNWFYSEPALDLDPRDYIKVNYSFIPPFPTQIIEDNDQYVIARNHQGIVTKALKEGSIEGGRMSMDQYLTFPVTEPSDFPDVKRRLVAAIPQRYPADLDVALARWKTRTCPLILGENCAANGFYWRAREFMGTENLSFAWYDYPDLMHEMMEFFADFIIETSHPVLDRIDCEYFVLNEDMSMKSGPLLGPDTYRTFIFPHLKRLVAFLRAHGVKHIAVDSDGDPTVLIPLLLDAGVDVVWPIERASNVSPQQWRKQFGKDLRLWGGVDKRELAKGHDAIRNHLRTFIPLIVEGGYIPTVDHTVPPDVSWDNFRYYMDMKLALLRGDFKALD